MTTGYKFVLCSGVTRRLALIKVEIPDDAQVIQPLSEDGRPSLKCRCNKYTFTEVINYYRFCIFGRSIHLAPAHVCDSANILFGSINAPDRFEYILNQTYEVDVDSNINHECGAGLHFFLTTADATNWLKDNVNPDWVYTNWRTFNRWVWFVKNKTGVPKGVFDESLY